MFFMWSIEDKPLISFTLTSFHDNLFLILGLYIGGLIPGLYIFIAGFQDGTEIVLYLSFD
jgi:hypothetical protein